MQNDIFKLSLDVSLIIPIIEDAIDQEQIKLEANRILQNESDYLKNLQGIAETKILLSLLRSSEFRP